MTIGTKSHYMSVFTKKNTRCLLCNDLCKPYIKSYDYNRRTDSKLFTYLCCENCDHIQIKNFPKKLQKYYGDEYYQGLNMNDLIKQANKEKFKIKLIKKYKKKGNLLEIGSSNGKFLYLSIMNKFNTTGIEMSKNCCKFIKKEINCNIICSSDPAKVIKKLDNQDIFTLWHSLEHLPKPLDCLKAIAKKINKKGILIISTPNPDSFSLRILGKFWPHVDAPRHLNIFSKKNLTNILRKDSFELLEYTTMDPSGVYYNKFSWYISLNNIFFKSKFNFNYTKSFKSFFLRAVSELINLFLFPAEKFYNRGSCYTAVFIKK